MPVERGSGGDNFMDKRDFCQIDINQAVRFDFFPLHAVNKKSFTLDFREDPRLQAADIGKAMFEVAGAAAAGGAEAAAVPAMTLARQKPPMSPRDELTALLHAAAEVEHSLMVQYLYASFSLPTSNPMGKWKTKLMQIAKEEMGHLMGVQNILLQLGAPLNFEREDYPYNELYPYPFKLERLSLHSVARYVLAEMPAMEVIPPEMNFDYEGVVKDSGYAGGVNRVGVLYAHMAGLAGSLGNEDVFPEGEPRQAAPTEWKAQFANLVLRKVTDPASIARLLEDIGEQGEGLSLPGSATEPSHFEELHGIYLAIKATLSADPAAVISLPVPEDPSVRPTGHEGYLEDPVANAWGDIFNHRYRCLLTMVHHVLLLETGNDRVQLRNWCFLEMKNLTEVSKVLTVLPRQTGGDPRMDAAGTPFELPYTLQLPSQPRAIWRHHLMLANHGLDQVARLPAQNTTSKNLGRMDVERIAAITSILQP